MIFREYGSKSLSAWEITVANLMEAGIGMEKKEKRMEYTHIVHPFGPLYDEHSRILILGSLPSVKSREQHFFYGHPRNRFWPLLAGLFSLPVPGTIEEKKRLVLSHGIALWDTIYSCDIKGSGDSSIKHVTPTDLRTIVDHSKIRYVFCNGNTSGKYYRKFQQKELGIEAEILPSTSPANAAWSAERLAERWKIIRELSL